MSSTWLKLARKNRYRQIFTGPQCLVVTATDNKCAVGVVGMIKSFVLNSGLNLRFLVLGKDLSTKNREMITTLGLTQVVDLDEFYDHKARDHWCTWILEIFWLKQAELYDYVFYVDADVMVRKSLLGFIQEFRDRENRNCQLDIPEKRNCHNICVVDHKRVWHENWFERNCKHNFNAGFIVFSQSFFGSELHENLKKEIIREQPSNDEVYLRKFFNKRCLLYAPTKFNGRIIWLNKEAQDADDVYVVHFVGQENKPWLSRSDPYHREWHKIFKTEL
tara:strand:- start:31 stop:858 length:828 start_codon:yes stop_codon:yes gene_type:complete